MRRRPPAPTAAPPLDFSAPLVDEVSAEYVGRWQHLVSTTNWEKGCIISQWRHALSESGAPAAQYSDEAWSRRAGQVTPQHVGRLRRVYERFGRSYEQYPGLYWSHFQAALDWLDAEMWLEGAVHSGWSVAQMRHQRWEALGAPPELKPRDEDIIAAEWDEDAEPIRSEPGPGAVASAVTEVREAERESRRQLPAEPAGDGPASLAQAMGGEPLRPFENLPPLPPDLNEAFEAFKLAILNHKLSGWQEISLGGVLAVLEALKQLALAARDA